MRDGNPKWEDVVKLADIFQMINETTEGEGKVDMMSCSVDLERSMCGTPACHAGWWGVFSDEDLKGSFSEAAEKLAESVGFKFDPDTGICADTTMERWACENQKIWGNSHGKNMFCDNDAFGNPFGITIQDIATHWYGVAERLYNIQVLGKKL